MGVSLQKKQPIDFVPFWTKFIIYNISDSDQFMFIRQSTVIEIQQHTK